MPETFDKALRRKQPWIRFRGTLGVNERHLVCLRCRGSDTIRFGDKGMLARERAFVATHRLCVEQRRGG